MQLKRHSPIVRITIGDGHGGHTDLLVVRVAEGGLVEREEVTEVAHREVPLHVFLIVHHTRAQRLLVRLTLEYLLLYRARLQQTS